MSSFILISHNSINSELVIDRNYEILIINRMKTHTNFESHKDILRALGPLSSTASALGVPYPTFAGWALRDVPVYAWKAIIEYAALRDVRLTADDLLYSRRGHSLRIRGRIPQPEALAS